jgi:hypothetical protein
MVFALIIMSVPLTIGAGIGYFYAEREGIRRSLNESTLRIALNLRVTGSIHKGNITEALDTLNSMNERNLVYLRHYDAIESGNADFLRRKRNVLSALSKEWAGRLPLPKDKSSSLEDDTEWQEYLQDLESYITERLKESGHQTSD